MVANDTTPESMLSERYEDLVDSLTELAQDAD